MRIRCYLVAVIALLGCTPKHPLTPAAELCNDPSMTAEAFCMPAARIEPLLTNATLVIVDVQSSPAGITEPDRLTVRLTGAGESLLVQLKWKNSAPDGDALNNSPRKELAAYSLGKLLFDEQSFPVPPTVARCLPLADYQHILPESVAFDGSKCAFGVLAYWLQSVTPFKGLDRDRFDSDAAYKRHLADFNVFTHLIDHRDSRASNFLQSADPTRPRVFSIDNGIAFGGAFDARVTTEENWGDIVVPALSRATIERLRGIDGAALHDALGVVAQFRREGDGLVAEPPGDNLTPAKGVRVVSSKVQLGLTKREIDDVVARRDKLLANVDAGKLALF